MQSKTMEHLALKSELGLKELCDLLYSIFNMLPFVFDFENETEWGESEFNGIKFNVSRPFEEGTLQEWDDSVPDGCNFGIALSCDTAQNIPIPDISSKIANELRTKVIHRRTWIGPIKNVKKAALYEPVT